MSSNQAPNWKKGDIICLLNIYGRVLSVFEAEHDPHYGVNSWTSKEDWHYGLRNCKELRLANQEDIDQEIKIQIENVKREKTRLNKLLNFRERLSK